MGYGNGAKRKSTATARAADGNNPRVSRPVPRWPATAHWSCRGGEALHILGFVRRLPGLS